MHLHGGSLFSRTVQQDPHPKAKEGPKIVHLRTKRQDDLGADDIGAMEISNDGVFGAIYATSTN